MAEGLVRELERLRQLERMEEQLRERRETVVARLMLLATSSAETGAGRKADTVRRVGWRAGQARQKATVTLDDDPFHLPMRLALTFWALVDLGHGAGGDPLAYRSAADIATWIADHRQNGERPSGHCIESYVSKLRKWDGRFEALLQGDKNRGWRLAVRTPITIDGEP